MAAKKAIQTNKADEEAMMNEMDITGQALEDLQNQNKQLIDQLKERDNTNLKLMTDVKTSVLFTGFALNRTECIFRIEVISTRSLTNTTIQLLSFISLLNLFYYY